MIILDSAISPWEVDPIAYVLATADGSHPSLPAPPCGSVRSSARPGSAASAAALPGGGPEFFGCSSAEVERIRRVFARTRPL